MGKKHERPLCRSGGKQIFKTLMQAVDFFKAGISAFFKEKLWKFIIHKNILKDHSVMINILNQMFNAN